jgi:hypothetical protein
VHTSANVELMKTNLDVITVVSMLWGGAARRVSRIKLNLRLLAVAVLLSAVSAYGQGKFEFDWVATDQYSGMPKYITGAEILFHASFIVDASLTQPLPGTYSFLYPSGLSSNVTMTVTSPDHSWPQDGTLLAPTGVAGTPSFYFDSTGIPQVCVFGYLGGSLALGAWTTHMQESVGNTLLYQESGYWQATPIPEPSIFALIGLGLLGLIVKRAAGR